VGLGSQNCNLELSNAHVRVEESYDSSGAPIHYEAPDPRGFFSVSGN
jgi:hypothetical protein